MSKAFPNTLQLSLSSTSSSSTLLLLAAHSISLRPTWMQVHIHGSFTMCYDDRNKNWLFGKHMELSYRSSFSSWSFLHKLTPNAFRLPPFVPRPIFLLSEWWWGPPKSLLKTRLENGGSLRLTDQRKVMMCCCNTLLAIPDALTIYT